jgi:hypothetical protein
MDNVAVQRALDNLHTYDLIGLAERHDETLSTAHQLLPSHFSWAQKLLAQNKTLVHAANPHRSRDLDNNVRATLLGIGKDHLLYREAEKLFAKQWMCRSASRRS